MFYPENGNLKVLFIAKTPAVKSVEVGHYFQGKNGTAFWNKLAEYNILKAFNGGFPDEFLLSKNYGITDIVKIPRNFGNEPTDEEYRDGIQRITDIITNYKPEIIVFVYKKVLDNIIRLSFGIKIKSNYGFNNQLDKYLTQRYLSFLCQERHARLQKL